MLSFRTGNFSIKGNPIARVMLIWALAAGSAQALLAQRTLQINSTPDPIPRGTTVTLIVTATNGTTFVSGDKIKFNQEGGFHTTTFVDSTHLRTTITPSNTFSPPTGGASDYAVWVFDSSGSFLAGTVVSYQNPVPVSASLNPSSIPVGNGAFSLTVKGVQFISESKIQWNNQDRTMTSAGPTQLVVSIPASDVSSVGSAQVVVVNPAADPGGGGGNSSTLTFTISPPCSFSVSPASQSFSSGGGTGSLHVSGTNGCAWSASSSAAWIRITSGGSGSGSGNVAYSVDANNGSNQRTGMINVADKSFFITEAGSASTNLLFPVLISRNNTSKGTDNSLYTGIAAVNLDASTTAALTITAYDKTGASIAGTDITNPAAMSLLPGEQQAIADTSLFGTGLASQNSVGWIRLESTTSRILGFFLLYNNGLTVLDGADVSRNTLSSVVFPEVVDQGFTQINAANPGSDPASVTFKLMKSDGTMRATASQNVPGNGVISMFLADLFPGVAPATSDYVLADSTAGIVSFEFLNRPGQDADGLTGQDATTGATTLYSPQYVVGDVWASTVAVINLDNTPGTVSFRFIKEDGTLIANSSPQPIAGQGKIYITDQAFLSKSGAFTQGYLVINSSGPRLTGSVVFTGRQGPNTSVSALPLVSTLRNAVAFSQLASDETYFTGLAILNPNDASANTTIDVFDEKGSLIGTKTLSIGARQRQSRVLTEYFPNLGNRSKGYFKVTVDQNVASFAIYGTRDLRVLSAVPPQLVP